MKTELKQSARVVVQRHQEFLLGKRQNSKNDNHKWVIMGGKIEPEETPIQAAFREIAEETGRDPAELLFLFSDIFGEYLTFYYLCTEISEQVRVPDDEHSAIKFHTIDELSAESMGQNHYEILLKVLELQS